MSAITVAAVRQVGLSSCRASRSCLRRPVRAGTLELDAVGVLEAKLPRDFAGADFSRMRADEGDKGVPLWGKTLVALFSPLIRLPCRRSLCSGFGRRLRWRGFGRRRYRRTGLAGRGGAIGLRLRRGFLRDRLLGRLANGLVNGFGRLRIRFGRLFCLAALAGLAFLAPRFGLPPPLATRSSISAMASSRRDDSRQAVGRASGPCGSRIKAAATAPMSRPASQRHIPATRRRRPSRSKKPSR